MKIRRTSDFICIELPPAEASVLLDELVHVRGGARLPKIKQVCAELEIALALESQRKDNNIREEKSVVRRTKRQEKIP